ncbi:MAG: DNA polymerase IV [Chloroflexota bacterium]
MDLPRAIALVDLDAFYASVETVERPELTGKPLLVGGSPEGRGVVAAASYAARAFGCHSAMPIARALRLCPHAVVVPPRFSLYRDYSARVMTIIGDESPQVEQMSIDEAYLDLTPIARSADEAEGRAHRIQARVRLELGLPCSVGMATSKLVAKVACEAGKPSGFTVVSPGAEATFLAPLPVEALPGIGPRSAERLRAVGLISLGQVAGAPVGQLTAALGPWGAVLGRRARGEDPSPVRTEHESKSVSAEETFAQDVDERERLEEELERLAGRVARSLVAEGLVGRTVVLKLRYADFTTITRSASRDAATAGAEAIAAAAHELLAQHWASGEPIRLVGVGVGNLRPVHAPGQFPLPLS